MQEQQVAPLQGWRKWGRGCSIGGSRGEPGGPWPPTGLTEMKNSQICSILHYLKKVKIPRDPPNLRICFIFSALTAADPLQCERLEAPVQKAISVGRRGAKYLPRRARVHKMFDVLIGII